MKLHTATCRFAGVGAGIWWTWPVVPLTSSNCRLCGGKP